MLHTHDKMNWTLRYMYQTSRNRLNWAVLEEKLIMILTHPEATDNLTPGISVLILHTSI